MVIPYKYFRIFNDLLFFLGGWDGNARMSCFDARDCQNIQVGMTVLPVFNASKGRIH